MKTAMPIASVAMFLLFALGAAPTAFAADFGSFSGDPILSWDRDGRTMMVIDDFTYTDSRGNKWTAGKGARVDGASIPQLFWSLVGGPFEGQYRNASIVHDTECTAPYRHRWQDVHEMFYEASRAGGVGWLKAKVMFAAVYHFGPRWPMKDEKPETSRLSSVDDFFRIRSFIRRNSEISIQAIEGLTHESLAAQVSDLALDAERRCGAEMDQTYIHYLDEKLSRGEFVPGGSRERQGSWENYLRCER